MITVHLSLQGPHLHEVEHGEQLGGQPPAQPEHGAWLQPAEPRAAGGQLQLALSGDS